MAVFGFICLLLIALWVTASALAFAYASVAFGGKPEAGLWVLAVIAALLWYGVYHFFPFSIAMKGTA